MLVLGRKVDQRIKIGDDIWLMVVSIQGDKVRLGIDAPREVAIHREEVWLAIQSEAELVPEPDSAETLRQPAAAE